MDRRAARRRLRSELLPDILLVTPPVETQRGEAEDARQMHELRAGHDIAPLVIHASYLINLCSQTESVRTNSAAAFRGEVERAMALGADYLVLHPGSWKGLSRTEALQHAAENIECAIDGLGCGTSSVAHPDRKHCGSEFSMGGTLDQIADLLYLLDRCAPVDVCLDTCHTHVAGYDWFLPTAMKTPWL